MRSPGRSARRSSRRYTNLLSQLMEGSTNDSWKRKGSRLRHMPTARQSATFQHGKTTTMDCKGCSSMPPRANQVPTRKDPRTEDPKDRNRTKGLRTSQMLSATDAARKATTRMNAMPGSSVITYKDPASTKPRTTLFERRKALAIKLLKILNP
jgi:hypothetical protein